LKLAAQQLYQTPKRPKNLLGKSPRQNPGLLNGSGEALSPQWCHARARGRFIATCPSPPADSQGVGLPEKTQVWWFTLPKTDIAPKTAGVQ